MSQSATPVFRSVGPATLPVEARFDGGRVTSGGGLPWLDEPDTALGLCAAFAAAIPDWRRGPVRHGLGLLIRQRVFQIACGYEDQDDADFLRRDPLLMLVCGQLPETGRDLASQPTLSRLENAVSRTSCYRLALALGERYLHERERDGVPTHIVLDLDGTDAPTHGAGRERLSRLLRPAQVSSAAGLRWGDRPAHHRRAAAGHYPRPPTNASVNNPG